MSAFENVVGGKLKLKGRALNVKASMVKKKKKHKHHYQESQFGGSELPAGGITALLTDTTENEVDKMGDEKHRPAYDDHLTPAEKRYLEQREKIDLRRLAKIANKSHRDRIQEFNQYLANLSEHYDIPKVGPG